MPLTDSLKRPAKRRVKKLEAARSAWLISRFKSALSESPSHNGVLLAFSGGLDSSVLLHLLKFHTNETIKAMHINHGLSAKANDWASHCQQVCAALGVAFLTRSVQLDPQPGSSPEERARTARYQQLTAELGHDELLLTAHHLNDQAETLLLRLMRGSGVQGLAAIAPLQNFAASSLLRPLLDWGRDDLLDYASEHQLSWVEDDSNSDQRFDRNFIRQEILPRLQQRWPAVIEVLGRNATLQAEAASLLKTYTEQKLQDYADQQGRRLQLTAINNLPLAEQKQIIYAWLAQQSPQLPSGSRVEQILTDVVSAREDASPLLVMDDVCVRRYRQHLYLLAYPLPVPHTGLIDWNGGDAIQIPGMPSCTLQQLQQRGLKHSLSQPQNNTRLQLSYPAQGIKFALGANPVRKSLKQHYQEAAIPPWVRAYIPALLINDELAAVPGLGVVHEFYSSN